MKNIKEKHINICGKFSEIRTKDEFIFLNSFYSESGNLNVECKRRKNKSKKFIENITFCSSEFIINTCFENIKEVKNGFIASNSVVNYYGYKNRIYKSREDAKKAIETKLFKEKKEVCFGYLAQLKFYYSTNYIKDFNCLQVAKQIKQFCKTESTALKIAKKFLKSNVIGYKGQNKYITQ
jgi:hypothetical protein